MTTQKKKTQTKQALRSKTRRAVSKGSTPIKSLSTSSPKKSSKGSAKTLNSPRAVSSLKPKSRQPQNKNSVVRKDAPRALTSRSNATGSSKAAPHRSKTSPIKHSRTPVVRAKVARASTPVQAPVADGALKRSKGLSSRAKKLINFRPGDEAREVLNREAKRLTKGNTSAALRLAIKFLPRLKRSSNVTK